jgi:lipopolysaccharide/colanic/teichoic acid biosynthesis glycosyltransferase
MPYSRESQPIPPPSPRANDVSMPQRGLDILLAGAALVLFAPLLLLISLIIYIDSGAPVLFSQTRLGQYGSHFRLYKFRKLHAEMPSAGAAVTVRDDIRMTRVGRWLARTKLDELPQLWNILKGEMSVVGPRPESLAFADCFTNTGAAVLEFRPGIFGPNQTFFRNEAFLYRPDADPEQFYRDVLFPLKVRVDLAYFTHRTLPRDLAWIGRGMLAVFGWGRLSDGDTDVVASVEDWIQRRRRMDRAAEGRATAAGSALETR